jgi:cytochrome c oxidase subunit 3
MSSEVKSHPYHMVEPSIWPFVGATAALVMAIGSIMYMHGSSLFATVPGFVLILLTFYMWCRDIVREANANEGGVATNHTEQVKHGLRVGMILFITSEVMFFFAFFWAWFNSSITAINSSAHEIWPPADIIPLHTWELPALNTLILLTSGATLTWAHHALNAGDRGKLKLGLLLTIGLGILFTCLQAYEYAEAAFTIDSGIYGSAFYIATGFHGFHVIVGTIFLIVCYMRATKGDFTAGSHVGFQSAAWYWHFVDVVWIFLFCAVYWWGSAGYVFAE